MSRIDVTETRVPRANLFPDHDEVSDHEALAADPLVSIFVTAYMHGPYLEQCIDSIAGQRTGFAYEIVIAEDCSPDDTRDVALAMQRRYPHLVRVVSTPKNKGGGLNTLFGISMCRGELIGCCEGDDFWIDEDKLAVQVAALQAHPEVDLSFTSGYRLYMDGSRIPEWDWGREERILPLKELVGTLGWPAPTAALLFRGPVLRGVPEWYGIEPWGDLVLLIAGSVRGGAHYDPRRTVCYRIARPNSFTVQLQQSPAPQKIAYLKGAIKYLGFACDYYHVPRRDVAHRINDYRLSLAKLEIGEGNRLAALRTLASIGPMFLLRGAGRRLLKSLRERRRGISPA